MSTNIFNNLRNILFINVGNVGPKITMWRGVIWPRDSLLPGGRGREPRELRERERESERKGQVLKYP
jgi:hypothetical protein